MVQILEWIAFYLIEVIPFFFIARKCGHEYAWLAFVPIANLWLLCDMADLEPWFLVALLVPGVDIVFMAVIWWKITENTNKPGWIGLLMLIPVVNLFVGYYIAFVDTGDLIA